MAKKKLIDLYPYRIVEGLPEFLIFKRSKGKIYENQWRMVGGKVEPDETYWQAALRELKEETGLNPVTFWAIPSVNQFYEPKSDTIHIIPAFAAEINRTDRITLDDEHSEYRWIDSKQVENFIQWPEQIKLIQLSNRLITSNQILDSWLVPLP